MRPWSIGLVVLALALSLPAALADVLDEARTLEKAGDLRKAEALLTQHLEAEPDRQDVRLRLAEVLLRQSEKTSSAGVKEATATRARALLEVVVDAEKENADAVAALARAFVLVGDRCGAVETLDAWLDLDKDAPPSLVLQKGRILYDHGREVHKTAGGTWPLPAEAKRLFERAHGVLLAAAQAAPASFDAWIHVAWASQMLGLREDALLGYERALLLDPESSLPLRGLAAFFAHDPKGYEATLRRLVRDHAEAQRVLLLQGWEHVRQKRYDDAIRILDAFLKERPNDADALFYLGRAHEGKGEEKEALVLFRLALEKDPRHLQAADELESRIRKNAPARAKKDLESLRAVRCEYEALIGIAPDNPYLRNNYAFLLREAWLAHRKDEAWRLVLNEAVAQYEEAVRAVGPWTPKAGASIPWAKRYHYAQFVCDAGVIRQNYAEAKDLREAERCYLASLRWSDHGYLDAWTFLAKIYETQERWEDLKRLSLRCAEGLANEKGEPLTAQRDAARAKAEKLVQDGQVD